MNQAAAPVAAVSKLPTPVAVDVAASYSDAIEILMGDDVDFRSISIALAKCDPALFVKLVRGDTATASAPVSASKWHAAVFAALRNGNKVLAIKNIREATGFGLKEAKDLADHLTNWLRENRNGYSHISYIEPTRLQDAQRRVLEELKADA